MFFFRIVMVAAAKSPYFLDNTDEHWNRVAFFSDTRSHFWDSLLLVALSRLGLDVGPALHKMHLLASLTQLHCLPSLFSSPCTDTILPAETRHFKLGLETQVKWRYINVSKFDSTRSSQYPYPAACCWVHTLNTEILMFLFEKYGIFY